MHPWRVRFAPSPTGFLHLGVTRIALINACAAQKTSGAFILRLDDTDAKRDQEIYAESILNDLRWLGLSWDKHFRQSDPERQLAYQQAVERLIASEHLYPCYETPEELEAQREEQRSLGLPPVYNRSQSGSRENPVYWRFRLFSGEATWEDQQLGSVTVPLQALSDPVVVRQDGSVGYLLASVIDDIDSGVTHILRGADHITNTAMQWCMFRALLPEKEPPIFGHFPLLKNTEGQKLSKRRGDLTLQSLRDQGMHPMALVSFLLALGTAHAPHVTTDWNTLLEAFDIDAFGHSNSIVLDEGQLWKHNFSLLKTLPFVNVQDILAQRMMLTESAWNLWKDTVDSIDTLQASIEKLSQENGTVSFSSDEARVLQAALENLPNPLDSEAWEIWIQAIQRQTGLKGRAIYHPMRLALSGQDKGPLLRDLVLFLGYETVQRRLYKALHPDG